MSTHHKKDTNSYGWGVYLAIALIVAALCVAVIYYIGWFDGKTGIDTVTDSVQFENTTANG